jgi:hypothetical protein
MSEKSKKISLTLDSHQLLEVAIAILEPVAASAKAKLLRRLAVE